MRHQSVLWIYPWAQRDKAIPDADWQSSIYLIPFHCISSQRLRFGGRQVSLRLLVAGRRRACELNLVTILSAKIPRHTNWENGRTKETGSCGNQAQFVLRIYRSYAGNSWVQLSRRHLLWIFKIKSWTSDSGLREKVRNVPTKPLVAPDRSC